MSLGLLFVGVIVGTGLACILSSPQKNITEDCVDMSLSRYERCRWEVNGSDGCRFTVCADTTEEATEIARRMIEDKGYVNYSFKVYN